MMIVIAGSNDKRKLITLTIMQRLHVDLQSFVFLRCFEVYIYYYYIYIIYRERDRKFIISVDESISCHPVFPILFFRFSSSFCSGTSRVFRVITSQSCYRVTRTNSRRVFFSVWKNFGLRCQRSSFCFLVLSSLYLSYDEDAENCGVINWQSRIADRFALLRVICWRRSERKR